MGSSEQERIAVCYWPLSRCERCGKQYCEKCQPPHVCDPEVEEDDDSDWEYEADDNSYGTAKWT
jgi:hypothetical protein